MTEESPDSTNEAQEARSMVIRVRQYNSWVICVMPYGIAGVTPTSLAFVAPITSIHVGTWASRPRQWSMVNYRDAHVPGFTKTIPCQKGLHQIEYPYFWKILIPISYSLFYCYRLFVRGLAEWIRIVSISLYFTLRKNKKCQFCPTRWRVKNSR